MFYDIFYDVFYECFITYFVECFIACLLSFDTYMMHVSFYVAHDSMNIISVPLTESQMSGY